MMNYDLPDNTAVSPQDLHDGLRHLAEVERPKHQRLWTYYRNPLSPAQLVGAQENAAERPYRQGQEWGLPARITGYSAGPLNTPALRTFGISRKEVVVENDIGWRVEAMVDYLFGKPIVVNSLAQAPDRRDILTRIARAALLANGSLAFLQQAALLGAVYGFVDIIVKLDAKAALALRTELAGDAWSRLARNETTNQQRNQSRVATTMEPAQDVTGSTGETSLSARETTLSDSQAAPASGETTPGGDEVATSTDSGPAPEPSQPVGGDPAQAPVTADPASTPNTSAGSTPDGWLIERLARLVRFELVHPSRSVPLPRGAETPTAYAQVWEEQPRLPARAEAPAQRKWWQRAVAAARVTPTDSAPTVTNMELLLPDKWYRYSDGVLTAQGVNSLGRLPVIHIQNVAVAFDYTGRSDVEPLIPLQDELNTRLSDRAYRITMTSFKMFLGKGIDNFLSNPVGPGRMWSTDNESAKIEEFGGDERCPSEEQHISDIRDAMDKASGVPPVAAGAIKDRIGQLSSAAALRVTLQSLLAKTERKRATYGQGITQMCELTLAWLSTAGLLPTTPDERQFAIDWQSAVPENTTEKLREAEIKANLGVPRDQVLREIGY